MLIVIFCLLFVMMFIPIKVYIKLDNLDSKLILSVTTKILFFSLNQKFSSPITKLIAIAARKRLEKKK
ncbi:hypothetical protein [Desulfonispora thiosulfatigenes]|uniref:hypothetical protein n=1 Tax=Desulfonispora thiosulfatigenes TaxID=83661 RepID=UPI000A038692|nr:hypothetical protein [Desulfonispora thiosulfatigenes]